MAGRDPKDAYDNFIDPLQEVVACVSYITLKLRPHPRKFATNTIYSANLGGDSPVILGMSDKRPAIGITVMQQFRIIKVDEDHERGPYKTQTVKYLYSISDATDDKEIIAFQWTPEVNDPCQKRYPHLHLGERFTGGDLLPGSSFHKMHIPTGRISVESFIRMAIEEFGAEPKKKNWRAIIRRHESAFIRWRTRS